MFSVKIYKNGIQTNGAEFETKEQALEWIAHGNAQGWWQTEERREVIPAVKEWKEVEIQPEIKDEDGNVIQERIVEVQEVVIEPEKTVVHPATHTYEIVDISEEIARQKAVERQRKMRLAGEAIVDELNIKLKDLNLSVAKLQELFTDRDAIFIRELLWTGSLDLAKDILLQNRSKFESIAGKDYVDWLANKIEQALLAIEGP